MIKGGTFATAPARSGNVMYNNRDFKRRWAILVLGFI